MSKPDLLASAQDRIYKLHNVKRGRSKGDRPAHQFHPLPASALSRAEEGGEPPGVLILVGKVAVLTDVSVRRVNGSETTNPQPRGPKKFPDKEK